jgi:beta-glucosidase
MITRILLTSSIALATLGGCATTREPDSYRDLNRNGRLDPYEDVGLSNEARANDLIDRMTVNEKVGALLNANMPAVDQPYGISTKGYDFGAMEALILQRHVTSGITRLTLPPALFAEQNNALQRIAERGRLGIPITINSDPRNHFQATKGLSTAAAGFSQWPETLGLAALDDPDLVRRFAANAAREYRAIGIHMGLSPQVDLATDPRWPRTFATFGSDPTRVSVLGGAYVQGFQGGADGLTRTGVAMIAKHWVGYGAAPGGLDGHNHYGRTVKLDNSSFARHVDAFRGALAARTAGVMPAYPIVAGVTLNGKPLEPVAPGFSRELIEDLLRDKMGYRGIVISDWGILSDCPEACRNPTAQAPQTGAAVGMPWGVESLSLEERAAKTINAGVDQVGGADDPAPFLAAVRAGKIGTARLDEAVRRVMLIKFQLGLFDNPYVDPAEAERVAGDPAAHAEGAAAQRAAQVVLENKGAMLPLTPTLRRVWLYGIDAAAARDAGLEVVATPEQAQIAIVRLQAPAEALHPHHFFGAMQREGRLDFRDGDAGFEALKKAAARVPTIVAVDLDRPAILTNIRDKARALIALFGASDAALLDVVTGRAVPRGKLPFELPSSMAAVEAQHPALPDDSAAPLYPAGAGLRLGPPTR